MVVRRRRATKRRRNRGKKSGAPRTRADKSLSRRISKLENEIERKYLDFTTDDAPTNSGVAKSLLSGMADGNNYNQRIGNQVTAKKLLLQYRLNHPAQADVPGSEPSQIRVMLVWDTQSNGQTAFQIFTGTSPTSVQLSTALLDDRSGMISMNATYNVNTRQRYKILYDVVHNINHGCDFYGQVLNVKKSFSLHNSIVKYSDSTTGLPVMPSRNLVLVYFDSLSLIELNANFTARFFYTDA